jgi:hypothetical protein
MLEARCIGDRFWLFIADGCEVKIFGKNEPRWQVASYCILRFGALPEWISAAEASTTGAQTSTGLWTDNTLCQAPNLKVTNVI